MGVVTDITSGVELSKTAAATDEGTRIEYRLESTSASVARVRVIERLPTPVERRNVSFPDEASGRWEFQDDRTLVYVGELSGSEPTETAVMFNQAIKTQGCTTDLTVSALGGRLDGTEWSTDCGQLARNGHGPEAEPPETNSGSGPVTPIRSGLTTADAQPAVGFITTGDNDSGIGEATLRVLERGLAVFVATSKEGEPPAARVAEQLGATVVRSGIDDPDRDDLRSALEVVARERSVEGVIVHENHERPIDLEASLAAVADRDDLLVDAVPRETTRIVAGIPAYNEAETVADVVTAAREYVDKVVVVDDSSTDDTAVRARKAGATVVEHDHNRGYGGALKTLFETADDFDADHLVTLDADDQHDPSDIPALVEKQRESGAGIVVGSRFGDGAHRDTPLYRRFGLWVITTLTNLSMGAIHPKSRISDAQSGFRAYDAATVASLAADSDALDDRMGASIDILHHAHENDLGIAEVPTTIDYDVSNANTRNPVRHGLSVVTRILTAVEQRHPLAMVGLPGALAALGGIGTGYLTLARMVETGRLPVLLAALSSSLLLVGVLMSVTSATLHSVKTYFDDSG